MQLDDFNITAEYMEYSDSSNKSEWGEPLPCWIKYESESKELSIKFEYEQEGKPNTYVWFKGIVDMLTYPCSVELRSNKPNVTEESMLLEIINDGENWYFEGVVYDPYTEKIDGVLVNRIAERMIYINQVDPDENDLDF